MCRRPLRLATGDKLVDYATAARILGTTIASLRSSWLRPGWLRPVSYTEGRRRFVRIADIDRAKEARARLAPSRLRPNVARLRGGIADPIPKAEATRLAGAPNATFAHWLRAGRIESFRVGRFVFVSRAAVPALIRERDREKAMIQREVAAGQLLRAPAAARRLGVSVVALYKAFKRGILEPVHFELVRRTFMRATEVERVRRARLVKRRGIGAGA